MNPNLFKERFGEISTALLNAVKEDTNNKAPKTQEDYYKEMLSGLVSHYTMLSMFLTDKKLDIEYYEWLIEQQCENVYFKQ